jgi:HK97 family phage major capsid protein/HK97 family phage prohead protease
MDKAAMIQRAYSVLTVKAIDDDEYVVEGMASTPTPDAYGDIVEPMGARFSVPMPLLWQHSASKPVGEVEFAKPGKDGIPFRARIRKPSEFTSDTLRERALEAWESVKTGLVRGVSIGFRAIEYSFMDNGGIHFLEWAWIELSLVTIPANAEATIAVIKSQDREILAASGLAGPRPQPSALGITKNRTPKPKGVRNMTTNERIAAFEARRAAHQARMQEISDAAGERGETMDESEQEEFDTLHGEIKEIDGDLARQRALATLNAKAAKPVEPAPTVKAASESRGKPVAISTRPNREKGIGFARYVMALANTKGNRFEAAQYAKDEWGDGADDVVAQLRRKPAAHTKAAVAAGDTGTTGWAAELFEPTNLVSEFLEMLRPMTLIGRIPGLRTVPFNIKVPSQTGGGTYAWVGEGQPKPLTAATFGQVTLGVAKAAGIIVLTDELVRFSSPSAEALVRDEMLQGITRFLDAQFIDPTIAAVTDVSPASITNGVSGTAASDTTEAAAKADLNALLQGLADDNYPLGEIVLITSESIAFALGGLENALGQQSFMLSVGGGEIRGVPVVTSNSVGAQIVAVHAPSIFVADEGGVEIDMSREASVQMDDSPDPAESVDADTVMVSLWQANLIGLRAERFINWKKARSTAVDRIHTVAYA